MSEKIPQPEQSTKKEKLPPGERSDIKIIGKVPKDLKEQKKNLYSELFGEQHLSDIPEKLRAELKERELEKDQIDKDIIRVANEMTNEILESDGRQPFDIPEKNIHILPSSYYFSLHGAQRESPAATVIERQLIIIDGSTKQDYMDYAGSILHEIFHLKGCYVEELRKVKKLEKTQQDTDTQDDSDALIQNHYRMGFMIGSLAKKEERLSGLRTKKFVGFNEGIVSTFETTHTLELLKRTGNPNIIEYLNKVGLNERDQKLEITEKSPYSLQMHVIKFIVECVAQDQQISEEAARNKFYQAHNSGHIISTSKLINNSFGGGAFEFIGTMDKGEKSAGRVLDFLQRRRRLMEKPDEKD